MISSEKRKDSHQYVQLQKYSRAHVYLWGDFLRTADTYHLMYEVV